MSFFSDIGNFFGNLGQDVANIAKPVVEVAAPVVGGIFGGPLGAAAGGALSGYLRTGHAGGALEGAAIAGLGDYALSGASGAMFGGVGPGAAGGVSGGAAGAGGGTPWGDIMSYLGSAGSSPEVSQAALGLGTASAPGYVLPATGGSLFSDIAGGGGSNLLGTLARGWGTGNMLTGLAQIYGAHQANQNAGQLLDLVKHMDAYGPYRAQAAAQLNALANNPSDITQLPGYQAGIEAINRDAAARGYFGSGNQEAALGMFGNQMYNQRFNQLASLAGIGFNPVGGASAVGSAGQSQLSGLGLLTSGFNSFMQ